MTDAIRDIIPQDRVHMDEPMCAHTTFKTGGAAKYYIEVCTCDELSGLLRLFAAAKLPCYIVGNGSNLLVSDEGYDGAVVTLTGGFEEIRTEGERLIAGGGAMLARASRAAQGMSLTGLEFAAGIPGSIGGAVVMNAGAYGGEMSQVTESVAAMDETGETLTLTLGELELGYRTSIFKRRRLVCTGVTLSLKKGDAASIAERMEDFNKRRREKQPLEYPSAGSTFKRPEGNFAGKLIMEAGFSGYRVGGAMVSEKHCGFVINAGGATSSDIYALMDEVARGVYEHSGVRLEPEVCMLGRFAT